MRKWCTLDCVSPHESRFDALIRGPQIAFEMLRALRLVEGGRVEILRNRSRCRISGVPDIHHELTGTLIRAQRFDTRWIRPVDGNPSHSKGTSRRRESARSGARRLTISGNSCSGELANDGHDKDRCLNTRASTDHCSSSRNVPSTTPSVLRSCRHWCSEFRKLKLCYNPTSHPPSVEGNDLW
jgi:hypothetical protein